jgi:hypothetical protein
MRIPSLSWAQDGNRFLNRRSPNFFDALSWLHAWFAG